MTLPFFPVVNILMHTSWYEPDQRVWTLKILMEIVRVPSIRTVIVGTVTSCVCTILANMGSQESFQFRVLQSISSYGVLVPVFDLLGLLAPSFHPPLQPRSCFIELHLGTRYCKVYLPGWDASAGKAEPMLDGWGWLWGRLFPLILLGSWVSQCDFPQG